MRVIEIICINNDAYIETKEDLNEFSNLLLGEAYDPQGELIAKCLSDYFYEVWNKSQILEFDIKKRLNPKLFVIVYLNFDITDNFSEIQVQLVSPEDLKLKKKDEVIFERLFERHFKPIKPLRDRLIDL